MSDQEVWETKFVEAFVVRSKRNRYRSFLRDAKKRQKILDRLDHNADFEFENSMVLDGKFSFSRELEKLLISERVDKQCWLISSDMKIDGRVCSISEGADLTAAADWGTVMICPPRPIAVYRPESSEATLYLLK